LRALAHDTCCVTFVRKMMVQYELARSALLFGVIAAWAAFDAKAAQACSCTGDGAAVLWPRDGATDVPLDTPIVIERSSSTGQPEETNFEIVDEDGYGFALRDEIRLSQVDAECWASETRFLKPEEPLLPNTVYTLSVGRGISFTTGTTRAIPHTQAPPRVEYLHVAEPEPGCDGMFCGDLAEVRVDFGAPVTEPVWLMLRSTAQAHNENRFMFEPASWWPDDEDVSAKQLSVMLGEGSTCIDLAILRLDGSVLLNDELCDPDACVVYAGRGHSTCGGPPFSSLDMSRLSDADCAAPPLLQTDDDGSVIYPARSEPEAGSETGSSWGCTVLSPLRPAARPTFMLFAIGIAALFRKSRHR